MLYDDAHGTATEGNIEHGVESSPDTGNGEGWNPIHLPRGDGTWFPAYRDIATNERWYATGLSLNKNETYRIEWHIAYGAGVYTVECRYYDASGAMVADETDFLPSITGSGTTVPLDEATIDCVFADHRYFRCGTNGPNSNFPGTGDDPGTPPMTEGGLCVYGAFAVGDTTWLGAYAGGI